MSISLLDAFDLHPPELISLVGGGGKTTLMFALANAIGRGVITTTTTRIFAAQMALSPAVAIFDEQNPARLHAALDAALAQHGQCLVVGPVAGDKATGVPPHLPAQLLARQDVDVVIVEADGSRGKPIKAPAEHEPVVPPQTTLLVPVVGMDAVDGRIADVAHRPELVAKLLQKELTDRVTPTDLATLITYPDGLSTGQPLGAAFVPLLNKVDGEKALIQARQVAHTVHAFTNLKESPIVLAALRTMQPVREVHTPVTAVVLAAGEGKRMGDETKQLLPWGDTTVLGQTLRHLRQSLVHDIRVVTGYDAASVAEAAAYEMVKTIHNPDYAAGEMLSSLQTAVRHLPLYVTAVLVMLADQPMIRPETIDQILIAYWQGHGDLVAPVHNGRRGNPVLIGRRYFDELLTLPVGDAPRTLLKRHPDALHLIDVGTDTIHRDLDRPEDYARWRPGER